MYIVHDMRDYVWWYDTREYLVPLAAYWISLTGWLIFYFVICCTNLSFVVITKWYKIWFSCFIDFLVSLIAKLLKWQCLQFQSPLFLINDSLKFNLFRAPHIATLYKVQCNILGIVIFIQHFHTAYFSWVHPFFWAQPW